MQCNSLLCSQSSTDREVFNSCLRWEHVTAGSTAPGGEPEPCTTACFWLRAASGQALPLPALRCSRSASAVTIASRKSMPGFSNQAFLHLGLWASLVWKTLTHVRTLTNPSIFFWNESIRPRFTKTALWCSVILWRVSPCIETCSIGCLPTLFRKLGQRARRTMSFVSPFLTHFFTRNTRN